MSVLDYSRPLIMGILNVTPDSFSDGGQYLDIDTAVEHAMGMIQQGADIIDIGGESTRPGSERVNADEQIKRTAEVISNLNEVIPEKVNISIDTTLSKVAKVALQKGATIINDISAGRDDPDIMKLAAEKNCPYIMMHMQGTPQTMQDNPSYDNVIAEIISFFKERAASAQSEGVIKENIIIDPGIGFGKTQQHNLELMRNLDKFVATEFPVLLGTSRKRFMREICKSTDPDQLLGATCATTVLGVQAGIKIFRVHDVLPNRQAADIAWAIKNNL